MISGEEPVQVVERAEAMGEIGMGREEGRGTGKEQPAFEDTRAEHIGAVDVHGDILSNPANPCRRWPGVERCPSPHGSDIGPRGGRAQPPEEWHSLAPASINARSAASQHIVALGTTVAVPASAFRACFGCQLGRRQLFGDLERLQSTTSRSEADRQRVSSRVHLGRNSPLSVVSLAQR